MARRAGEVGDVELGDHKTGVSWVVAVHDLMKGCSWVVVEKDTGKNLKTLGSMSVPVWLYDSPNEDHLYDRS